MAVWAHCRVCERLCRVFPRGWREDLKTQRWVPETHPRLGDDTGGEPCPGEKEVL